MPSIELSPEPLLTAEQISVLADPGKQTDDTPIIRAIAVAGTAEGLGISLNLTDIAIATGQETPGRLDNAFQVIKACTPFLHSRNSKLAKVWDAEKASIWNELEERKTGLELSNWIGALTPAELRHVEVVDCDYGDRYLSPLRLVVKGAPTTAAPFELGDHFNYEWEDDSGPFAPLPSTVRERLAGKQTFWEGLVSNGVELREFKEHYFTKIKVGFAKDALPPEVAWLEAKDAAEPEQSRIFAKLQAIQEESGHDIYLWAMTKVPPTVIQDTLKIAGTQGKFITTWLPGFVKREKLPTILDADAQAMRTAREAVQTSYENGTIESNFRRRYLLTQVDQQLEDDLDFEHSLRNIEHLRSLVLGIELAGGTEDREAQEVINQANTLLDMELSGEKVTDRILIDTVLYATESAKQILTLIPPLVGVAEGLQHIPLDFIRPLAKAVGAGDDLLGEASEVSNLRAQGYKWSELRSRFGFVGGVAIGAFVLGTQIENIQAIDLRLAAVAYACTTFATTGATLVATMRTSMQAYKSLGAQGKLEEKPYLSSAERTQLQRIITGAPSSEAAVKAAQRHVSALLADYKSLDQKEVRKRVKGVEAAARRGDPEQAIGHVVTPSRREALRAAYTEIFKANPVREGKLASMPLMLGSAAILGGVLLSTPFFYIPFGMAESLAGLGRAKFASKHESSAWHKKVLRLTNELSTPQPEM